MSLIEELLEEIIRVAKLQATHFSYDSTLFLNLMATDALNKAKQSIINNNTQEMHNALDTLKHFYE